MASEAPPDDVDRLKPWYSIREFARLVCEPIAVIRQRAHRGTLPTVLHLGRRVIPLETLRGQLPELWESIVLAQQLRAHIGRLIRPYYSLSAYAALTEETLRSVRRHVGRGRIKTMRIGGRHYVPLSVVRDASPELWGSILSVAKTRAAARDTGK